jgi:hypothetical protein
MNNSQSSEKTSSSSKSNENNDNLNIKTIYLGFLVHNSTLFNLYKLFTNYFTNSKANNYKIVNENNYEFNPNKYPNETIKIHKIGNLKKIKDQIKRFNEFLIFLDIQQANCLQILDEILNVIIDCSVKNNFKKCYILGFYNDRNLNILNENKMKYILDAKEITYEYNQINYKNENEFLETMEFLIKDINDIEISRLKGAKEEEILNDIDHSTSKCILI